MTPGSASSAGLLSPAHSPGSFSDQTETTSRGVTQVYLHLIDTQRIYRDAYTAVGMAPAAQDEARAEFDDSEV